MSKSALLVMDVQNGIVSHFEENQEWLASVQQSVKIARRCEIPVIYVRVAFSEGYPEISPNNKAFSQIRRFGSMTTADDATQIYHAVRPEEGEPIVTKFRVSAFAGSNLEVILRAKQIDTLVLTGVATSGVVLSTLREAADKDFVMKVLSDACVDRDEEVHRVLMGKVFPHQADVLTVDVWARELDLEHQLHTD